ncbi:MAG: 16S rRNA m(7)G-527 methyltransferase [Glomeribacter sp. 1016415]|nr:16S rRNA m(7)G-527 methyltransferase [Glomeribacter sp. 1016415]
MALGIVLDGHQQMRLLAYLDLLAKWNRVYNLTAIRDPHQMLVQHLLDSLAILPYLRHGEPSNVLDVGSGGGLPGVVLAIAQPAWKVTLNDIVQKKTAFLLQAKATLSLSNVAVVTGRVESLRPGIEVEQPFDTILCRAFAKLADFVSLARHLLAPGGSIWAMKGTQPTTEIAALPADMRVVNSIELTVPFLNAERHLVQIKFGA